MPTAPPGTISLDHEQPGRWAASRNTIGEVLLALAAALLFFGAFSSLLEAIFPSGVGIRDLLSGEDSAPVLGTEASRRMYADGLPIDAIIGHLTNRKNDVRMKSEDSVVWSEADQGMALRNRESVQTLVGAAATITFEGSGAIDLGPNTLIVLKDLEEDIFSRRRQSSLLVLDGELRGRFSADGGGDVQFEVPAGAGTARIRPARDESGEVVFRIDVKEDRTATVTVESGSAEIVSEEETITVAANEAAHLVDWTLPPSLTRLLHSPRIQEPRSAQRFSYREAQPEVSLRWSEVIGVRDYRLVLARDPGFEDIVLDQTVRGIGVVLPGLPAGTYYWRIAGQADGKEATSRAESSFAIVRDAKPPELRLELPEGDVYADHVTVRGSSERGSRIRVSGVEVVVDRDGRFSHEVPLVTGPNVISVEAIDRAGNVVYRSSIVNRRRSR